MPCAVEQSTGQSEVVEIVSASWRLMDEDDTSFGEQEQYWISPSLISQRVFCLGLDF